MKRKMPWGTYLWPGLPQAWVDGSWSALAVAVSVAALLNLALLSSFVWTELVAWQVRNGLWIALCGVWLGAGVMSAVWTRRRAFGSEEDRSGVDFAEAVQYYLTGDWFRAERELQKLLEKDARDAEARLTLATLLRHTGRLDEAEGQLQRLSRLEGAGKWELEIGRERELLADARTKVPTEDEAAAGPGAADPSDEVRPAA